MFQIAQTMTDPEPRNGNFDQIEKVNLNETMQQSLQHYQKGRNSNIVIRCESLPVIEGDGRNMAKAFDDIIRIIVNHPPAGSKLFLHIDCEEERIENDDPELAKKVFTIHFHTNCQADGSWKIAHGKTIENCSTLLAQYGASFTMNNIKASGCLFSISLLGKM